jgi:hypothetical protein
MLISHLHRFIYLKTMKTAGTSVEIYFERFCVDPTVGFEERHRRDQEVSKWGIIGCRQRPIEGQTWYHHLPAAGVRQLVGPEIWTSYYKFCVIRNPYDKVVSAFWFWLTPKAREELQEADFEVVQSRFAKWVRDAQLPNDRSVFLIDGNPAVDRFVRFETLDTDLEGVCKDLALAWTPSALRRYKSGLRLRPEHFSRYYSPATSERVSAAYAWEIQYFGYALP